MQESAVAAAWLRQRALVQPMLAPEAATNPYAALEASAFVNALSKLPPQARILSNNVLQVFIPQTFAVSKCFLLLLAEANSFTRCLTDPNWIEGLPIPLAY